VVSSPLVGSSHPFDPQAQCPPLAQQLAPPHLPVGQVPHCQGHPQHQELQPGQEVPELQLGQEVPEVGQLCPQGVQCRLSGLGSSLLLVGSLLPVGSSLLLVGSLLQAGSRLRVVRGPSRPVVLPLPHQPQEMVICLLMTWGESMRSLLTVRPRGQQGEGRGGER